MADGRDAMGDTDPLFAWHPDWAGKRASDVRRAIEADLRSDQRAYELALSGAEQHENDALQSTIALDRKWGPYDLNWAETDPAALAERIVAFERERERRREMIPFADWRAATALPTATRSGIEAPSERMPPPAWLLVVALIAIVLLLVVLLVRR